jgi:hypothetical protein
MQELNAGGRSSPPVRHATISIFQGSGYGRGKGTTFRWPMFCKHILYTARLRSMVEMGCVRCAHRVTGPDCWQGQQGCPLPLCQAFRDGHGWASTLTACPAECCIMVLPAPQPAGMLQVLCQGSGDVLHNLIDPRVWDLSCCVLHMGPCLNCFGDLFMSQA